MSARAPADALALSASVRERDHGVRRPERPVAVALGVGAVELAIREKADRPADGAAQGLDIAFQSVRSYSTHVFNDWSSASCSVAVNRP